MDLDDIFGDIFERVDGCEEVVEEWLVWCVDWCCFYYFILV